MCPHDLPPPASGEMPIGTVAQPCSDEAKGSSPPKKWDQQCILDIFCNGDAEDRAVVAKLPRLHVEKREPKQVHFKKYTGGKWVDSGFPSAGSASGTNVKINEGQSCKEAASTLYHEVVHTDQPPGMAGSQREYEAYIKEEKWRIKKVLPPGGEHFRKDVPDPLDPKKMIEVPNEDAIKKDVDETYAYNPPTPLGGGPAPLRVVGLAPDKKNVLLEDGTTRPPKEGDAYRLPDTGGKVLEVVDPKKWKCP